jgi:hypothetical protein
MCKKSSGSFQMNFHNERDYTFFGKNYVHCYANFEGRGQFSKPAPEGTNGYKIDFSADCGCETATTKFNAAYKKAFGDGSGKLLALPTKKLIFADGSTPVGEPPSAYNISNLTCRRTDQTLYKRTTALPFLSQRAITSPANAVIATAIDSQMTYANTDIDPAFSQAVAHTTLYSQAAARYVLKEKGVDITNSDYLKTKQWYDEVITQMTDLGFFAQSASGGDVNEDTHAGAVNLKDIVTDIVKAYIAGPELTAFENLADLLTKNPDDTGVKSFLDFWWSAASSHTKNTSVAWGPVSNDQGSPSVTCVYMNIDVAFTDWRSLFVSYHGEKLHITSSAVTLNLDMEVYNGGVGKKITSELGDRIKEHIKDQKLDFGS